MVCIDPVAAIALRALFRAAQIDVDFGARATGAGVAHFPEVVFFGSENDAVFGNVFFPDVEAFAVLSYAVFGIAFKNRNVELVYGNFVNRSEQFPSPANGFFFEVIAKRPIAQHFEHGVVVGIYAYFFEVVVLTRNAQAFLGVGHAAVGRHLITQEKILELVHAGVGEHKGRVVLDYHWGRRNDLVSFTFKKVEKLLADS